MRTGSLAVLLLFPRTARATQYSSQVEYSSVYLQDPRGKALDLSDVDQINDFDCKDMEYGYITRVEGDLKIRMDGSYEMELRMLRLFGREKDGDEGMKVSYKEDDASPNGAPGHEHPLGNFSRGSSKDVKCYFEITFPSKPTHSPSKSFSGPDFLKFINGASSESKVGNIIFSLALLEYSDTNRSAPMSDDFKRITAASQDSLTSFMINKDFLDAFSQFDRSQRCASDNKTVKADAKCDDKSGK